MKIGILGTGEVGKAIGNGFIALGHEVLMGAREAGNPKAIEWADGTGGASTAGTFEEAARFGELVVLATLGLAGEEALRLAGHENLAGKILWDATNPLDFSKGMPPALVGGLGSSAGEKHQRAVPAAKVLKVFNTVGNALMFQPKLAHEIRPDMFICGDDAAAKQKTAELLADFGWETIDVGAISAAHYLEAMCLVWVLAAAKSGKWMQAFKLVPAA